MSEQIPTAASESSEPPTAGPAEEEEEEEGEEEESFDADFQSAPTAAATSSAEEEGGDGCGRRAATADEDEEGSTPVQAEAEEDTEGASRVSGKEAVADEDAAATEAAPVEDEAEADPAADDESAAATSAADETAAGTEAEAANQAAAEPASGDFEAFAAEQAAAAEEAASEEEFEAFARAPPPPDDDEAEDAAGAAPAEPKSSVPAPIEAPQNPAASTTAAAAHEPDGAKAKTSEPAHLAAKGGGAKPSRPASAPLSNASRTAFHSKLRSYEAKRRSAYASKLASSSLYWRSFRELLHASVDETERAETMLRGSAAAVEAYGVAMRAAHDDTLDGSGLPVTDPRKKKKLLEAREKRRAERGGGGGGSHAHHHHHGGAADRALYVSEKSFERAADRGAGVLDTLIESHGIMADRFAENAKYVREEVIPEIAGVREQLTLEVAVMERLGDAIMEELQAAEKEVEESWKSYYAEAEKSLRSSTNQARRRGATSAESGRVLAEEHFVDDCADVWSEEMKYRMSVAFLSACWEKSSAELSKLFGSMKGTECNRRFRLRELLIAFLHKQERLWLSLPSILTPVVKDLADKPLDRSSIESEVQASIRLRAQSLQREENAKKKELRKKGIKEDVGPGLKGVETAEGDFELSSPLVSDLLVKANVIEKKSSGMMSSWKTTLAVVTADSFLHLFELPSSVRVHSGSAPEVAFHALVPPVEVPTVESAKSGKVGKMMKDWYDMLTPAESLALPNCTVSFKEEKNGVTFEITERILNTGASSMMLGKTTTRKLFVRTLSTEETKEWIVAVRARK